ncbi:hypothetical protein BC939DRAFT_446998 [Gamsiella multidivaricata]|uniref:uncharacterized protein n=1 Tax=Gamsiella multidivaricata TaxID=101098 RepID=UPI00221E912A|nr:uncharacterized protein BC939DRAFT_446998 [Gamsiella multidivaricata]KAI7826124.1 hypothetical protein BC939DRAFT_446998 [Gamsiella multidivaricata]
MEHRTRQRTGVALNPTKFMNHRSKAPSVSTALFPFVLRREPSSRSSSTSKGSGSRDVRLNPPPALQDLSSVSIKKTLTFGEVFMKSMEMRVNSKESIERMKLEYQRELQEHQRELQEHQRELQEHQRELQKHQREQQEQSQEAEAKKARIEFLILCIEKGYSIGQTRELLEMIDGVKQ